MRLIWVALVGALGCGRFGFDPVPAECDEIACPDAGGGDATAATDAPELVDDAGGGAILTLGASADTAINSFAPDLNYGGAALFNVRDGSMSTFVGLIGFDARATGTVAAAELRLTTTTTALSQGEIAVYVVSESWDEGTQNGAAGVASWNEREAATAWTAPGCGPGSRDASAVARFAPTQTNMTYTIAVPPALVQNWFDVPGDNHGLALVAEGIGQGDVVGFWARENGADAPALVVDMTP